MNRSNICGAEIKGGRQNSLSEAHGFFFSDLGHYSRLETPGPGEYQKTTDFGAEAKVPIFSGCNCKCEKATTVGPGEYDHEHGTSFVEARSF